MRLITAFRWEHRWISTISILAACLICSESTVREAHAVLPTQLESLSLHDHANFQTSPNRSSNFGTALALTDQYLAVGMSASTTGSGPQHAVFIYSPNTGQLLRTLAVDQPDNDNFNFGTSVAISGNLAVVGACYEHVSYPGGGTAYNSGAAYVFDLTTGAQLAKLVPQDPHGNQFLASSVAIRGSNVLVGGWGAAYLFNGLTGQQLAKFNPSSLTGQFGISVALNDDIALIGANSDESRGFFTGAAYVFDIDTYQELRKIVPADAVGGSLSTAGDNFGISVSLDGDRAIVGSPLHSSLTGNGGAAYVFDVTNGAQLAKLTPPLPLVYPENFGGAVAIQGNLALVGAQSDSRHGEFAGASFLYDWTNGQLIAELLPSDVNSADSVGAAVALGKNYAFVGAPNKEVRGGAYRFDLVPEPATAQLIAIAAVLLLAQKRKGVRKASWKTPCSRES